MLRISKKLNVFHTRVFHLFSFYLLPETLQYVGGINSEEAMSCGQTVSNLLLMI